MPGYGYKFHPDDDQLLNFLHCKAYGQSLLSDGEIKEIDLYSLNEPGKLFQNIQEKKVYIFTKLKKSSKNGTRVDRRVTGNRTWKGVDKGKPIFDQEGQLLGEAKNFVLINKINMKMGYNMKEYSLDDRILKNATFKDYVLCQIKRKITKDRTPRPIRSSEIDPMTSPVNSTAEDSLVNSASERTNMVSDGINLQQVSNAIYSPQSADQYSVLNVYDMDLGFSNEALVFQNQGCLMSDNMVFKFPQSPEEFQNQDFWRYDQNSLVFYQSCSVNSSVIQDNPFSPSISVEFCSRNAQATDANSQDCNILIHWPHWTTLTMLLILDFWMRQTFPNSFRVMTTGG